MRRRLRILNTLRRLYTLLVYGWCPRCNSSPPRPGCVVCNGSSAYGHQIGAETRSDWAQRWILFRHGGDRR